MARDSEDERTDSGSSLSGEATDARPDSLCDKAVDGQDEGESGFDILLETLNPDRDRAGHEYEKLRTRVRKLFEANRAPDPDTMVTEVFERVEKRLEYISKGIQKDEPIRNIFPFISGVARNVLREHWVSQSFKADEYDTDLRDLFVEEDEEEREQKERRLACLDLCLSQLGDKTRRQALDYYSAQGAEKIRIRKRIAREEGISLGTLRVRMHRIRRDLAERILKCLDHRE
ncbi:MAG: hypothetical protein L0229_31200 [Blastocatellia bacterium]|nr:hypothetical protein [Blastocatellia bacterium]